MRRHATGVRTMISASAQDVSKHVSIPSSRRLGLSLGSVTSNMDGS